DSRIGPPCEGGASARTVVRSAGHPRGALYNRQREISHSGWTVRGGFRERTAQDRRRHWAVRRQRLISQQEVLAQPAKHVGTRSRALRQEDRRIGWTGWQDR